MYIKCFLGDYNIDLSSTQEAMQMPTAKPYIPTSLNEGQKSIFCISEWLSPSILQSGQEIAHKHVSIGASKFDGGLFYRAQYLFCSCDVNTNILTF